MGIELFHVAKAVVLERILRRSRSTCRACTSILYATPGEDLHAQNGSAPSKHGDAAHSSNPDECRTVEMMQTLLLLIASATWFNPASYEALSLRSVLDSLVREDGIERTPQPENWEAWVQFETLKRTKLVVFSFFNIHTIVFDVPPMILSTELRLDLPCSEKEWRAANEREWRESRDLSSRGQNFQDVFHSLFSMEHSSSRAVSFSSMGGYVLIHALLQQIWLVRNIRLPYQQGRYISLEEINSFECALKRWCSCWERNQESSMDPLSPHGPLSFTSTTLMRLAYIRINIDLGPARSLGTWDPDIIAKALNESPPVQRSSKLTRAALHCVHALSIPVKLGINYVAHTHVACGLINMLSAH